MKYGRGKSDSAVVAEKLVNKVGRPAVIIRGTATVRCQRIGPGTITASRRDLKPAPLSMTPPNSLRRSRVNRAAHPAASPSACAVSTISGGDMRPSTTQRALEGFAGSTDQGWMSATAGAE